MKALMSKEKSILELKNEFGLTLAHKISCTLWTFPASSNPSPRISWQLAVFITFNTCITADCDSFKAALALLKQRLKEHQVANVHN